jgi:predicted transcriptional regulator
MTEQKVAILAVIINNKPPSIYKLAQLVERDFANVQRDCVALENMGFIVLEETKDSKKSKKPKLSFNYSKIIVQMPSVSYTHDLDKVA